MRIRIITRIQKNADDYEQLVSIFVSDYTSFLKIVNGKMENSIFPFFRIKPIFASSFPMLKFCCTTPKKRNWQAGSSGTDDLAFPFEISGYPIRSFTGQNAVNSVLLGVVTPGNKIPRVFFSQNFLTNTLRRKTLFLQFQNIVTQLFHFFDFL